MKVLGIETSCDETSAAVVSDGINVLSNVILSQVKIHAEYGGVVPEIASRNHLNAIEYVVDQALKISKTSLQEIDGIAVTIGPGLIGSLLVGMQFAKGLAIATNKPIVGVNHLESHVMAIFLGNGKKPSFPFVALAVSGGHTSLYKVEGVGRFTLLGHTLDDAAGEAFDKAGAMLGLPYPGGVAIDRISNSANPNKVQFPRAMIKDPSLNMSFSGLKTALKRYLSLCQHPLSQEEIADISASFQEAIVDILVSKTLDAARICNVKDVVVAGGVAANTKLRSKMNMACDYAGLNLYLVPLEYCTDNAAMVAGLGFHYLLGVHDIKMSSLTMDPFERHVMDGW